LAHHRLLRLRVGTFRAPIAAASLRRCGAAMKTPEEITYDAGRHALAEQEAFVNGIRQRTGTLLAAHALVASFLGAAAVQAEGLHGWSWTALVSLAIGLTIAAILLAPWKLNFAMDARNLYTELVRGPSGAAVDASVCLMTAGFSYQRLRDGNAMRVRAM